MTSQGEPISFELTADGAITDLMVTIRDSTRNEVLGLASVFRSDTEGAWCGTVSQSDITLTIQGRLHESGKAQGTLCVALECPSARRSPVEVSWSAQCLPLV